MGRKEYDGYRVDCVGQRSVTVHLLDHQRAAIKAAIPVLRRTGGFYINHDPGLGKSLTAIGIAKMLGCRHILILGPVVSLGVWHNDNPQYKGEIEKWWPEAKATILRDEMWNFLSLSSPTGMLSTGTYLAYGTVPTGAPSLTPGGDAAIRFVITNYDQTIVRITKKEKEQALLQSNGDKQKAAREIRKVKQKRLDAKINPLIAWGIDLLILDESHLIKSWSAERSNVARTLASHSRYRLLLSGTPAHSPLDWYPQWHIVAPRDPMWNQSYGVYKRWIAVFGGPTSLWVVGFRPDAKKAALRALAPYTHVAKSDILNLPEPIYSPVPIEMSVAEREAYRQMEKKLVVEIEGDEVMTAPIVLTKMLRLQQITAGHLQAKGIPSTKLEACLELLDQRRCQKVIVACRFKWEIGELEKALGKAMVIDGSVPGPDRRAIQDEFQSLKGSAVIVTQFRAGGMSLTLTKADALIFYSLEYSYIAYQQMFGRFFRIGLDHVTQVMPLLCKGTTDEVVWKALQDKVENEDLAKLLLQSLRR